jgi:predicted RNase H-like HicB family nuclease
VIFEQGPMSWGAWIPDLPGCVAAGETRAEVEELIREAIEAHIENLREHGEAGPAAVLLRWSCPGPRGLSLAAAKKTPLSKRWPVPLGVAHRHDRRHLRIRGGVGPRRRIHSCPGRGGAALEDS